jgi:hypothetical protein
VYDDIERISTQQRFLREQLIATDRADIDRSRVGNFRNEIQSLEARIDEVVERL